MNKETFDKISDKIKELTGQRTVFEGIQLVSYDESTRHAVIQVKDATSMAYVKAKCTHEVIEAFDSVLGVETTVSCVYDRSKRKEPHERFVM